MMLIQDYLERSTRLEPAKDLLIFRGRRRTYEDVYLASLAIARSLVARRLAPGFRAAILTDDPGDYVSAYFGVLSAGGIVVGMNTQTSDRTLGGILTDCRVSVVLTDVKFEAHFPTLLTLEPLIDTFVVRGLPSADPGAVDRRCLDWQSLLEAARETPAVALPRGTSSAVAQIIYTSGTTGRPKGVMLSHDNLIANTDSIVEYLRLTPADRVMAVLPFFYSYGNSLLLTHVAAGGSLIVNQQFLYPNVVLEEMAAESATGFSGVPSTFAILLNRSAIRDCSLPTLRYLTQAGGPMSPTLALALKELLPAVEIYIMYGQTEASARLSYLEPEMIERKVGSIGKAIPGVTLELRGEDGAPVPCGEVGEIVARGGNIMSGYWEKPEATAEVIRDDALWTGDLARQDEEGYFFIVGRRSDMIKSGSHRIAPKAIEDALVEHPAVDEVAVIGIADEILGEALKAFVVLKPSERCDSRTLKVHCRGLLPAYEVPQHFEFVSTLPKTTSGKVRKNELRETAQIGATR